MPHDEPNYFVIMVVYGSVGLEVHEASKATFFRSRYCLIFLWLSRLGYLFKRELSQITTDSTNSVWTKK